MSYRSLAKQTILWVLAYVFLIIFMFVYYSLSLNEFRLLSFWLGFGVVVGIFWEMVQTCSIPAVEEVGYFIVICTFVITFSNHPIGAINIILSTFTITIIVSIIKSDFKYM